MPRLRHPIQLIGLLRRQQDLLSHRPYGRHVARSVPGLAEYDKNPTCPARSPIRDIGGKTADARHPIRPAGPCTGSCATGSTVWNTRGGKAPDSCRNEEPTPCAYRLAQRRGTAELRIHVSQPAADAVLRTSAGNCTVNAFRRIPRSYPVWPPTCWISPAWRGWPWHQCPRP